MSTLKLDTLSNFAGTKSVPANTVIDGSAKAWVNFNGTGAVAIRAAFNVSSITDNGVGDYTANFTNPMPDAGFAPTTSSQGICLDQGTKSTTLQRITTFSFGGTPTDYSWTTVSIFR